MGWEGGGGFKPLSRTTTPCTVKNDNSVSKRKQRCRSHVGILRGLLRHCLLLEFTSTRENRPHRASNKIDPSLQTMLKVRILVNRKCTPVRINFIL